jgi:hypothetical protein
MLHDKVVLVLSATACVALFVLIAWVLYRCTLAPRRIEHTLAVSPRTMAALLKKI